MVFFDENGNFIKQKIKIKVKINEEDKISYTKSKEKGKKQDLKSKIGTKKRK